MATYVYDDPEIQELNERIDEINADIGVALREGRRVIFPRWSGFWMVLMAPLVRMGLVTAPQVSWPIYRRVKVEPRKIEPKLALEELELNYGSLGSGTGFNCASGDPLSLPGGV